MTRLFGSLVVALVLTPTPSHADELNLRDVIELHRTGLGDDLLIAVIDADGGPFRLSFGDIQDLKSDGLSERVIAALVRTGTLRQGSDEGRTPVVQVIQEVVTYVPTVIVVETDSPRHHHSSRDDGSDRGASRHGGRRDTQAPPATWLTRQEDGKNVTPSGAVRSPRPAAAWVTPRASTSVEPPATGKPEPKPR